MRFLENHDEARIAASLPERPHEAAAVIAYFVPGLRFFHEGQLDGRRIKTSLHLRRRTGETANWAIREFYLRLLECLKRPEVRGGSWQLLHCRPAWEGNPTWDNFIAFAWEGTLRSRILITVNFGATQGQCLVAIPFQDLEGSKYTLRDLLSPARYEWNGDDLLKGGLFLDMPAWGYHVFEMQRQEYRP